VRCSRERKQLTRTTADMFRLVPLLVIVVRTVHASQRALTARASADVSCDLGR
jgi:hypothetical protein